MRFLLHAQPRCPARRRGEGGVALVWATLAGLMVSGFVLAGFERMRAVEKDLSLEFAVTGQAHSLARAGLVDAFAWLRRQPMQPVTEFTPHLDLAANPPINETDDPSIGLVREFEITPGLWGRYEVRRGRPMDPYTDENGNGVYDLGEGFTDLIAPPPPPTAAAAAPMASAAAVNVDDGYGDGLWTPSKWTRDIAGERGAEASGAVWRLESRGLVFRRVDELMPLGEGRNHRVASATLVTEVRRLTLAPPAAAALCCRTEGDVNLLDRARLRGDELGIAVGSTSGTVTLSSGSEVLAPTTYTVVPSYDDSVETVFGVDWEQLKSMADVFTPLTSGVPARVEEYTLVVIENDVTYSQAYPLRGRGALVVRGDVTVEADSNSAFNGLLYVDGNLTVRGPSFIRGTVICTGTATIQGSVGDYVEIEHELETIHDLLANMGQYRMARALYVPDRRLLDRAPGGGVTTPVTPTDPLDPSSPGESPATDEDGDDDDAAAPDPADVPWYGWSGWGDANQDDDHDRRQDHRQWKGRGPGGRGRR